MYGLYKASDILLLLLGDHVCEKSDTVNWIDCPSVPPSSWFCRFFPGTGLEEMPHGNDCVITEIYFLIGYEGKQLLLRLLT